MAVTVLMAVCQVLDLLFLGGSERALQAVAPKSDICLREGFHLA